MCLCCQFITELAYHHIGGLVQERRNSIANALELRLSCTNPSIWMQSRKLSVTHWGYRQVSNISRTLVGNKIVDHPDVVGASPVGAAPTTASFST